MDFDFERLDVYQKALEFVDDVYTLSGSFPREERFGLVAQFRRAAISITLNIAEGSGRTKKDFRHFLRNARASCYECVAILHIAWKRSYLSKDKRQNYIERLVRVSKMLSGLIRSLGGDQS